MARGFFAELQHQTRVAAREQERAAREAERAHETALRDEERARKAEERAAAQLVRADAAEQKRLAKNARDAHVAAMEAEVKKKNLELSQMHQEIESLLAATLDVDDYVDLETLRTVAEHPPFDRTDLEKPIDAPQPIVDPLEPTFEAPPPPTGLRGLFSGKKHAKAAAEAESEHERRVAAWKAELAQNESAREAAASRHADLEAKRVAALEVEQARYAEECAKREEEATERNKAIDKLTTDLGYGAVDAIQEYISIVLSNSVYPEHFSIEHEFEFEPTTAELKLRVLVPGPDTVPTVSGYKYTKSADEITARPLSQKACKDRYAAAVHQVALRSMHEVFEADRRGLIKTISLEVGTNTIDPATGRRGYILFVAVGSERKSFLELDLSNVVPTATLAHLGASVSKNPFGLLAADASGIRRS